MICFLGRARVPPLIMTREYFRHCGSCHLCVGTESDDDTDELSLEAYRHDAEMTPYAYYQWAVCEREREHIPLFGPSVDRRTLAWIVRIMKSENIESLIYVPRVRRCVPMWRSGTRCMKRVPQIQTTDTWVISPRQKSSYTLYKHLCSKWKPRIPKPFN